MADTLQTSHSNLMDMRAKGKKLHRRTQSSSKHDINGLLNKKDASEEFVQEMIQTQNILNANATHQALDADISKQLGNEKEVIVDDIEDIPFTGVIVPRANNNNNPLNLISRRNLAARIGSVGNLYPVKRIHLLDQLKDNIDEFTGLGTIHEKKNSMDSCDTDTLARSPDLLSLCNSQGSKNPSRTHSKHSSLDIRPGHSKTSSADLRNINFIQPIFDLRPLSQSIKAEKENIHFTKKPSNFSNSETHDNLTNSLGATFGISSTKKAHHQRNQRPTSSTLTFKTTETNITSPKTQTTAMTINDSVSPKGSAIYGLKPVLDKSGKVSKNSIKTTTTTTTQKEAPKITENKLPVEINNYTHGMDSNIASLSESMKNLTSKTDMLENQIKSIFQVVDSFTNEKNHLQEKVKAQDEKIKVLMDLATKYEEEINTLKIGRSQKSTSDKNTKTAPRKVKEVPGTNILTTTDISSIESPGSDNSGFYTNKESKDVPKNLHFSSTQYGQKTQQTRNERISNEHPSSVKKTYGKGKQNSERT